MNRYLQFLWNNRWSVLLASLMLLGAGWYALQGLPESIFPDIDFPRVTVLVTAGNLPVRAMEDAVTMPLEEAAKGEPGVRLVRSQTGYGLSKLHVYFNEGVDPQTAYLMLQARLAHVVLPNGVHMTVHLMRPDVYPFAEYALVSNRLNSAQMMPYFAFHVRPALLGLGGVYRVAWTGRGWPEVRISLDQRRLAEHGLDAAAVVRALKAMQGPYFGGVLGVYNQQFVVSVEPRPGSLLALRRLVLPLGPVSADGGRASIALGELGQITTAQPAPERMAAVVGWRHALLMDVQAQPGADVVALAKHVEGRLDALRSSLPPGVHLIRIYDLSGMISGSLHDVWEALGLGSGIALLVVVLFLRRLDGALAVFVVVPLSLAGTFVALRVLGYSLDIMTLGGITAAVGALVDHAIVVVERGLHNTSPTEFIPRERVRARIAAILKPMTLATLTSCIVFLPLLFLSGTLGLLFRPMAVSIVVALLVSQVIALVVTPVLTMSIAARKSTWRRVRRWHGPARAYQRVLLHGMRRPGYVIVFALALATGGGVLAWRLPTAFLPRWDEGFLSIPFRTPVGSSVLETASIGRTLMRVAMQNPFVAGVSLMVGRGFSNAYSTPNKGALAVVLRQDRHVGSDRIMRELVAAFHHAVPSLIAVNATQVMVNRLGDLSGAHAPLDIELFGPSPLALHQAGERLAKALRTSGMFQNVVFKSPSAGPEIVVRPYAESRLYALSPQEIGNQLHARLWGRRAGFLLHGEQILPVRVGIAGPMPPADAVGTLPIRMPGNLTAPLDHVADVTVHGEVPYVTHQNLVPYAYMWLRPKAGIGLARAAARARAIIIAMHFPDAISTMIGGYYREQIRGFHQMALILVGSLGSLLVLMGFQFSSQRASIAAVLAIALSASGAFFALWLTGTGLDSTALLGLLLVFAIAVNNVVLVFSRAHQLAGGTPGVAGVALAARARARAVTMTMLADVLGFLPLIVAAGRGTDLLRPLAIAVIGGLVVSIAMSLWLAPVLFSTFGWSRQT